MLDCLNPDLKDEVLELDMNMVPAVMEEEMRTEMLELGYYLDLTRGLRDTDNRILAMEMAEICLEKMFAEIAEPELKSSDERCKNAELNVTKNNPRPANTIPTLIIII